MSRWIVTALACWLAAGWLGCKPYDPPAANTGVFESCCGGLGACIPGGLIDQELSQRLGQDSCREPLLCAPTELATEQDATFVACRADGDLEGRCLPSCLPEVSRRAERLSQADCSAGRLCLPCFDPRSGDETGACSISGDRPREPAKKFPSCCEGRGSCVPTRSIPSSDRERLATDTCKDALCVPSAWLADERPVPESCRAPGDLEGRCLPTCLPEIAEGAKQLVQDRCTAGSLCSPCYDPRTGEATGACEFEGDRPREPSKQFDRCCQGTGRCVPAQSVPAADRDRLAAEGCKGQAQLCAPSEWLDDPRPAPQTCRAAGDREGRCLSSCLPDIAARAKQLTQATCAAQQLCVPCFDPITGEDTGACGIDPDPGPSEPARTLANCCEGQGRCVPSELIGSDERARLAPDSCKEAGALCVPSDWLSEPRPALARCRATGDLEGRCFPSCLPDVAPRAKQLTRATCAAQQLCVPCFDPITGEDTGACGMGPDPGPSEPARTLANCCEGQGRCVPSELIGSDERARLAPDSCKEAGALCVPSDWLSEPRRALASCRATGDLEGRCVPSCLPEVSARAAQLMQANCAANQLCLPCFDPLTGKDTQACRLPGDPGPKDPPRQFEACCGEIGRCLPRSAIESNAQAQLGRDSCPSASDALCVPRVWIDGQSAPSCRATGNLEGRCLPRCLPQVAAQGDKVQRANCPAEHACVPCFDPLSGQSTGSCQLPGDTGPSDPPRVFERCCPSSEGPLGTCLPNALLPPGQTAPAPPQPLCPSQFTCVPDALVRTPEVGLKACESSGLSGSVPGACVPECLLGSTAALLVRNTCGAAQRCAPCSQLGLETPACD